MRRHRGERSFCGFSTETADDRSGRNRQFTDVSTWWSDFFLLWWFVCCSPSTSWGGEACRGVASTSTLVSRAELQLAILQVLASLSIVS